MLWFSQRKRLEDMYNQWMIENKVKDCPFNVVTFLSGKGLFDEKKVRALLDGRTHQVTTVCYGKPKTWDSRDEAVAWFLECMRSSEGAERDRYFNIYCKLLDGLDYCTDDED